MQQHPNRVQTSAFLSLYSLLFPRSFATYTLNCTNERRWRFPSPQTSAAFGTMVLPLLAIFFFAISSSSEANCRRINALHSSQIHDVPRIPFRAGAQLLTLSFQ